MSVIEKLAKPSHLINMNDIIREGHPTLRQVCDDVTFLYLMKKSFWVKK